MKVVLLKTNPWACKPSRVSSMTFGSLAQELESEVEKPKRKPSKLKPVPLRSKSCPSVVVSAPPPDDHP